MVFVCQSPKLITMSAKITDWKKKENIERNTNRNNLWRRICLPILGQKLVRKKKNIYIYTLTLGPQSARNQDRESYRFGIRWIGHFNLFISVCGSAWTGNLAYNHWSFTWWLLQGQLFDLVNYSWKLWGFRAHRIGVCLLWKNNTRWFADTQQLSC